MADFETPYNNSLQYICSYGMNFAALDYQGGLGAPAALTWVANLAVYLPFTLYAPYLVSRFSAFVATVACNIDVGVYDEDGVLLSSIGGVASLHTSLGQFAAASTVVLLPAGGYYLGVSADSAVAAFFGAASTANHLSVCGIKEQTTAYPLPATATFSATTHALYPIAGMASV